MKTCFWTVLSCLLCAGPGEITLEATGYFQLEESLMCRFRPSGEKCSPEAAEEPVQTP